ncbi:MAG: PepSY domain-containing protein [Hydrogenophaga sp.]|uniref:PepSY-associated TM helix domain-containing protein n=1 Tax=Hydrogenophaga sp. TaxID=1904254 RepID=UPI001DC2DBCC|nr:PepSY domain-containing protein [Hydrogenophaga sp.]MBX3610731.1 PepSY domain-containing protein [Hydrogenophaga sp.]
MSHTPDTAGAGAPARARVQPRFNWYALAWRLHAYAGLLVLPFLLTLAITGAVMVFFTGFQTRLGVNPTVEPLPTVQAVSAQAQAALAVVPEGRLQTYVAPRAADRAAWFVIARGDDTLAVAVDPYRATVLRTVDKGRTAFAWAERIHGTLLIGDMGDRLIEIAAWGALLMLLTGAVLWWPRGPQRWASRFRTEPRARGRGWWRSLHGALGAWTGAMLLVFLLSGLTWTDVTGARWLQAWGSFPAEKWDAVPTSTHTHAALNTAGLQEVPWGLAQTPLPVSGADAGETGVPTGTAVDLDSVAALARHLGFVGQHQIAVPQSEDGVFTVSADTMSGDLERPTGDRTVHIDRYSGRVLVDLGFADYNGLARTMAVAIALHQGDLGWWNALLNLAACLAVVVLCVAGGMMWWLRRPGRSVT